MQGVEVEFISTLTGGRVDDVKITNSGGEVTADVSGPFFVRARVTGERHRVLVTNFGNFACYDFVVDPDGMGTHTKFFGVGGAFLAAIAACAADAFSRPQTVWICPHTLEVVSAPTYIAPTDAVAVYTYGPGGRTADGTVLPPTGTGQGARPAFQGVAGVTFIRNSDAYGVSRDNQFKFVGVSFTYDGAAGPAEAIWDTSTETGLTGDDAPFLYFEDVNFGGFAMGGADGIVHLNYIIKPGASGSATRSVIIKNCAGNLKAIAKINSLSDGSSSRAAWPLWEIYDSRLSLVNLFEWTTSGGGKTPGIKMERNILGVSGYGVKWLSQDVPFDFNNNYVRHTGAFNFLEWAVTAGQDAGHIKVNDNTYYGTVAGCRFVHARSSAVVDGGTSIWGNLLLGPGSGTAIDIESAKFSPMRVDNVYSGWDASVVGAEVVIDDIVEGILYKGGGLTLGVNGFQCRFDNVVGSVSSTTILLGASVTTYVEVKPDFTIATNTTGYSRGRIPIGRVVTSGSAITTITAESATMDQQRHLTDSDTDTQITVEDTADEDVIRLKIAGTERATLSAAGGLSLLSGTDLLLYSDAGSNLLAQWDAVTGHISIGGAATPDANKPIYILETLATASATGLDVDLASSVYAGGGIFFGAKYTVRGQATSLTQGTLGGFQVLIGQEQAGAISNLIGLTVKGQSSAASGAITSWSVLRAEAQAWNATGGIPVTSHVIDANDQGKSGTTTAYGLRIRTQTGASSRSFIANALTLGVDAQPGSLVMLDAYGHIGVRSPASGTAKELRLYEDDANGTNSVGFKSVASRTADLVYSWPNTDPVTGQKLVGATPASGVSALSWTDDEDGVEFIIDGGGSVITTGEKGHLEVPFDCTVTGWTILGDASGSIVVDIWKDTYANFPPTVADTIAGTEKPTLSAATKNQDLALSSFSTTLTKGDILAYNVDSATTVKRVTVSLRVKRR